MDKYAAVRLLPFPTLASALGLDLTKFKRRKEDWQGPCPVHQSKTNNNAFAYHDSGKFHCFSCSAKGSGSIDLFKLVKNVGFQAAVEALGAAPKLEPAKEKSPVAVNSDATELKPLEKDSWRKFAVPCPWLEERIPDAGIRERYGVFCYNNPARRSAYSGRVMLPVKDVDGAVYGYLGRAKTDMDTNTSNPVPKYLFPKNLPKSRFLFGAHELVQQFRQSLPTKLVYLVESPFCVMKFASLGLPAVAAYGWSVSDSQLDILDTLCKGTVFLPDRNKAGEARKTALPLLASRLWVRFPPLPDGVDDPEQLSREQILAL